MLLWQQRGRRPHHPGAAAADPLPGRGAPGGGPGTGSLRAPRGGLCGGEMGDSCLGGAVLVSGGDTEGPSASSLVCSSQEQRKK